jgi:hypothetical protein
MGLVTVGLGISMIWRPAFWAEQVSRVGFGQPQPRASTSLLFWRICGPLLVLGGVAMVFLGFSGVV